jgi:hypothetical protein
MPHFYQQAAWGLAVEPTCATHVFDVRRAMSIGGEACMCLVEDGLIPDQKSHMKHRWISVFDGRVIGEPHEGENDPAIAVEYGEAVATTHFPQPECEMIDEESRRGGHVGNTDM